MLVTVISFIIVLGILIFVHEFGHYITAKWAGIRVEEFALGFGPKLIGRKKGETLYALRAIPLGGYCKMTGEFPPEDDMSDEEKQNYAEAREQGKCFDQKPAWKRLLVTFNGAFMNFILAVIIYIMIFGFYGIPVDSTNSNVLGDIIPGQPAAEAGLKVGDKIISINNQETNTWDEISTIIHNSHGQELKLKLIRDEKIKEITVTPKYDKNTGSGLIGITPEIVRKNVGIFQSIKLGFMQTGYVIKLTIIGFISMITGKTAADVGGPVMIANMLGQAAEIGLLSLLNLTAIITINLGIINLVPFPALDGGRIIFILFEMLRGKPVNPEKEGFVHIVGFVILMLLMVLIIYKDLGRALF